MALLGTLLGSGLAWLAAQIIMSLAPKFLIVVEPKAISAIAFTGVFMGLVAAIAPVQRIAKLDPALVFRK
jgi:ABC-type antimicrobial peptide transport system permease subunit